MSFLELLVTIFLVFMAVVAFNVLRTFYGVWRQMRQAHRAFSRMANNANENARGDEQNASQSRTKKFDKSYGDYVEYEEVPTNGTETQNERQGEDNTPTDNRNTRRGTDDRISDAEYEEIN